MTVRCGHLVSMKDPECGVALVITLWLIVLLAVPVSLLTFGVRDGTKAIENGVTLSRGHLLLDSGVELAVTRLLTRRRDAQWQAGRSYDAEFDGVRLSIFISDENGRINLNLASPEFLAGLVSAVGLPPADAAAIAGRIVNWRDNDGKGRIPGLDTFAKNNGDATEDPPARPFVDPRDLARISGISHEIAALLAPHVTIYSRSATINPKFASKTVLQAVPGLTPETIEQLFSGSEDRQAAAEALSRLFNQAPKYIGSHSGPALRILVAHGEGPGLPRNWGEAVVMLGVDGQMPYRILSWRYRPTLNRSS